MFHLEISSAVVTDSALYYCAVRPTVTGNTDSLTAASGDDFFWYRQYPGDPPQYLMYISGFGNTRTAESLGSDKRFSTKLTEDKTGVDLKISSAVVTDSALYYCAVRPTCKGEDRVIQTREDVIATEGHTVSLGCTFETTDTNAYLFWYKQDINDFPRFILSRFTYGGLNDAEFNKDRFDAQIQNTSVPLRIQNLQLSDSALYYCECKGEDRVIQTREDVIATEGHTVSLGCTFETISANAYLFWYKQDINDFPRFILSRFTYGGGHNAAEFNKDRFDAQIQNTSVPLRIQNLQMSDSALYYCGLKPTVTGNTDSLYKNLLSTKHTSLSPETRRQTLLTNRGG
ncbi:T cell receptor alpha variable 38-1 [Merluccius polli]|nr:T cell receptor alpha variable 38-1 [Merluccius polli]